MLSKQEKNVRPNVRPIETFRFSNAQNVHPSVHPNVRPFCFSNRSNRSNKLQLLSNVLFEKNITQRTQKKPQKRLYRRSKTVLNLSGSLYQVRLDNHRTFRVFYGSIGQTGMQQATLSDTDLALSQSIKYGRNTAEIEVSFLINQVYMDNFTHSILHLFHCKYTKYILYGIIQIK